MATNGRYSNALHINIPVPSGTVSGGPVKVGQICGVAITDRDADGNATVHLDRSWDVTVTGAVASVGLPVYITSTNTLTATTTGNFVWGVSLGTKGTGDGPLEVAPVGYTTQTAASA